MTANGAVTASGGPWLGNPTARPRPFPSYANAILEAFSSSRVPGRDK